MHIMSQMFWNVIKYNLFTTFDIYNNDVLIKKLEYKLHAALHPYKLCNKLHNCGL